MNTVTAHEPTDECAGQHCAWHNVDEPLGETDYLVCGECWHLYRTARDLRREYRRMMRGDWQHEWLLFKDLRTSAWRRMWRYLTVRADRIHFCPLCAHDF